MRKYAPFFIARDLELSNNHFYCGQEIIFMVDRKIIYYFRYGGQENHLNSAYFRFSELRYGGQEII